MGLFAQRESESWHKQIHLIVNEQFPIRSDFLPSQTFPWMQLRQLTDLYLLKKKWRSNPVERDARLVAMIQKYPDKVIAIAACAHAISTTTILVLLGRECSKLNIISYLQAIAVARHVNPGSVSVIEAERASLFISAYTSAEEHPGDYLQALAQILIQGIPSDSLIYPHIHTEANSNIPKLGKALGTLKHENKWLPAYQMSQWLSTIVEDCKNLPKHYLNPIDLLDRNFRGWMIWANWRPDPERLLKWARFDNQQRLELRDVLALEGPDNQTRGPGTLCTRLQAQIQELESTKTFKLAVFKLSVEVKGGDAKDDEDILARLLKTVDAAAVAGGQVISLLSYFCVGQVITPEKLDILGQLAHLASPELTRLVSMTYGAGRDGAGREFDTERIEAAMKLLPLLSEPKSKLLRNLLAPHLARTITDEVEENQAFLRAEFDAHLPSYSTQVKFQKLGQVVRHSTWLWRFLSPEFTALLENWPSAEDIMHLEHMRKCSRTEQAVLTISLVKKFDGYVQDCLVKRGTLDVDWSNLIKALLVLCSQAPTQDYLSVALMVAQGAGITTQQRTSCLEELSQLSDEFVSNMIGIIHSYSNTSDKACIDLAELLASPETDPKAVPRWYPVLLQMLRRRGTKLVEYALKNLKVEAWVTLHENLHFICGELADWTEKKGPAILQPNYYRWSRQLANYLPMVRGLEADMKPGGTLQRVLWGGSTQIQEDLPQILSYLAVAERDHGKSARPAMLAILARLRLDGSNAKAVTNILSLLASGNAEVADVCSRLIGLCETKSLQAAETVLASWLRVTSLTKEDRLMLTTTAEFLGMKLTCPSTVSQKTLGDIDDYLDSQYAQLFAEAQRLDTMRAAMKTKDAAGVSRLLAEIRVEDPPAIEDAFIGLSPELCNVVEKVAEREVEMLFPLRHLTQLQRVAMGVGNAQSLILRLLISDGTSPGFCIHLDNGSKHYDDIDTHKFWIAFKDDRAPNRTLCDMNLTPATYQLARTLTRHFNERGWSLASTHTLVSELLRDMGKLCITCSWPQGANLRRSIVCLSTSCSSTFEHASLEVRLSDIRNDPLAVDFLLSAIYAAILSGFFSQCLPGCPFVSGHMVTKVIDSLPSMTVLSKVDDLHTELARLGSDAEKLLVWVCTYYRGFLTSATGSLRIPSMPPGTLQFILASTAPEKEIAYANHIGTQSPRVLFHGTSLDRVFSILTEGLKICSKTPLQAHGAANGSGIYMAEEPATCWPYTNRAASKRPNWNGSRITCGRVLLGCENAELESKTGQIHLLKDPSSVVVRYVFLIPNAVTTLPIAGHIVPAMGSVFSSLRSGAL